MGYIYSTPQITIYQRKINSQLNVPLYTCTILAPYIGKNESSMSIFLSFEAEFFILQSLPNAGDRLM